MKSHMFETKLPENGSEIRTLQKEVSNLLTENNNLSSELNKIKLLCNSLVSKEANYSLIQNHLTEKESKIVKLKAEVSDLTLSYMNTQHKLELQYEKDVTQIKYQQENFAAKVEMASKIEQLNETFYNKILELENAIIHFKEEEQKRINALELKHDNRLSMVKKKMIDYLKNDAKNKNNSSAQIQLNSKLDTLHRNEIINELEFQSCLIDTLIKERDELRRKIKELQNDIKIHCEVENLLGEKNKKYEKRLLSQRDKVTSSQQSFILNTKRPIHSLNSYNTINVDNNNKTMTHFNQNTNTQLKLSLEGKVKLIEKWKTKYETARHQLESIERKYSSIGILCNEALEEIYSKKKLKVNEIYLSLDQFKEGNFDQMSKEQRYAALVIIIKYILPLINKEIVENNALDSKVNYIKTKIYSDKSKNNTHRKHNENDYTFSSATNTENSEKATTYRKKSQIKHIQIPAFSDFKNKNAKPLLRVQNKFDLNSVSLLKVEYE